MSDLQMMDWDWVEVDDEKILFDLDRLSITSSEERRLLVETPPPNPEPISVEKDPSWMKLIDADWNTRAPLAMEEDCTSDMGWYHGQEEATNADTFAERAFPPSEWKGKWNTLALQLASAASAHRQEAERWIQRLLFGERYTHTISHYPWANHNNVQWCTKPVTVDGRWPCLYTIIDFDPVYHNWCLQAVDPLVYIDGMEHLRYLTLDLDADDILSQARGFVKEYMSVGDQIWVTSITPSMRLADSGSFLDALEEARWMATTNSPPDGWWTSFRAKEFSLVDPSERTHKRLARVAKDGMTVEGKSIKLKLPVPYELRGREGFYNVFFRRYQGACQFFSAPPISQGARNTLIDAVRNQCPSRMRNSLYIMRAEPLDDDVELLVRSRTAAGMEEGYVTQNGRWEQALRLINLGSTGIRVKLRRLYDLNPREAILRRVNEDGSDFIYEAEFSHRARESGWTTGARVKVELADNSRLFARIQVSMIVGSTQTMRIRLRASEELPEIGKEIMQARISLDEQSIYSPSQERMIRGVQIPEDSRAERILSAAYDGMLSSSEVPKELSDLPDGTPTPGISQDMDWDKNQIKFVQYSAMELPLLYLDAPAGCGKTAAISAAVDHCLQTGDSQTVVIVAAATNTAVAVATRKMEELASSEARILRIVAKIAEEETRSDLQEWIMKVAADSGVSEDLRERAAKLKMDIAEIKTLKARCPELSSMTPDDMQKHASLEEKIRDAKARCTREVVEVVRPNVIAITLDSLVGKLQEQSRDPIKKYIKEASEIIIFVDEASQACESIMVTLAVLLPNSFHRYVGDPAQLEPHCLIHKRDFDTEFGARGIASVLASARNCPRLALRNCRRMHPGIARIASHLFYDDTLISAVRAEDRLPPCIMPDMNRPIVMINVRGREKASASGSKFNDEETAIAGKLARQLGQVTKSILVMAYYKEHIFRFKKDYPETPAATIDSAQGAEADVVILMTTKTFKQSTAFISDPKRTNVALTRAKRALFIIGCKNTLGEAKIWQRIVSYLDNKKLIKTQEELQIA